MKKTPYEFTNITHGFVYMLLGTHVQKPRRFYELKRNRSMRYLICKYGKIVMNTEHAAVPLHIDMGNSTIVELII